MQRYAQSPTSWTGWCLFAAVSLLLIVPFVVIAEPVAAGEPDRDGEASRVYRNLFEYRMCELRDTNWCPGGDDFQVALFEAMFADPEVGSQPEYYWWDGSANPPTATLHYGDVGGHDLTRFTVDLCEAGSAVGSSCPDAHGYDVIACTDGTRPVFYFEAGEAPDADKWIFKIQGGGADCTDDCSKLILQSYKKDFSSAYNENKSTRDAAGIFSNMAANAFKDYNVVMLDKCVGDRNLGDTTATDYAYTGPDDILEGTGPVYFHGHRIVLAVLNQLERDHDLGNADQILFISQSNGSNGSLHYIDRLSNYVTQTLGINASVYLLAQSFLAPGPEVEYFFETGGWPAEYSDVFSSTETNPGHIVAPNTPNSQACGPGYDALIPEKRSFNNWVLEGRQTTGSVQCDRNDPLDNYGGVNGRVYATEDFASGQEARNFELWGVDNGLTETWDESCVLAHAADNDLRACRDSRHVMTHHLSTPVFFAAQTADRNLRSISRIVSMWSRFGNVWWPEDMKQRVIKLAEVIAGNESRSLCADADMANHGFFVDNVVDHGAVIEMSKLTRQMKANDGSSAGLNVQMQDYLQYWMDDVTSHTVQCLDSNDLYDAEFAPGLPVKAWPDSVKCSSGHYGGGTQPFQICDDPGFGNPSKLTLNRADDRFTCQGPAPDVCASVFCDYQSIQAAINAATPGDTISLAGETFTETITVDKSLTIVGAGAGSTIVQAAGAPGIATTRVVTVTDGVSVTLAGFAIRYGYAFGSGTGSELVAYGGGIYNQGTLTLTQCSVYSNTASYSGGGIYNDALNRVAVLRIDQSDIVSNTASHSGGGLFNYAGSGDEGVVTITDSRIDNNAAPAYGGGIYNLASGTVSLSMDRCSVSVNSNPGYGGGIANQAIGSQSMATVTASLSTIADNTASNQGGGVFNSGTQNGEAYLTLVQSSVLSNTAPSGGGASNYGYTGGSNHLTISQSTFYSNTATLKGGGISNSGRDGITSTVEIDSSTLGGNTASAGGGIANDGSDNLVEFRKSVTITRSTLSDNSPSAVYNYSSTLDLSRSILGYNVGSECTNVAGSILNDHGYNLVEDASCSLDHDLSVQGDPKLDSLDDNGGPTLTYALLYHSPALDAILEGSCDALTDQRGVSRPQGSDCDIGAYEAVTDAWVDDDWSEQAHVDALDESLVWGANAFNNVGEAVDAVVGSTVHVAPGIYTETMTLDKDVTIIGDGGASNTIIQAAANPDISSDRVYTVTAGVTVTLEGLTIRYGNVSGGGGAIHNMGNLTVTRCYLVNNQATGDGGAIYNDGSGNPAHLVVYQSTIAYNEADGYGGGMASSGSSNSATALLAQSTVTGNSADRAGGVSNVGASAALTVTHVTVTGNTANNNPGGLGNANGTVTLAGSILANSAPRTDCGNLGGGTVINGGHNLVEDNTCIPTGLGDPQLGPLAYNGGGTPTHALLSSSPALDAILTASCWAAVDQRGHSRPKDAGCDVGSYEAVTEVWVDDDWEDQSDVDAYNSELDWGEDAFSTIGEGVDAVIASTVHVLDGTYTETLTLDKSVEIIGEDGAGSTIIQAAGEPGIAASRVITISQGVSVTIEGFTVRHGNAIGGGWDEHGGGIWNQGALTLTESIITTNTASRKGGGIFNYADENKTTVLIIDASQIVSNTASGGGGYGGAIFNQSATDGSATVTITHSTLSGNQTKYEGGAIYNWSGYGPATITLSQSTLSGNSSLNDDGGGIYNYCDHVDAVVRISLSTVEGNTAAGSGGGIYNETYEGCSAKVIVTQSILAGNSAETCGGGIYSFADVDTASLDIQKSTFESNTVQNGNGGAICNQSEYGPALVNINQSTFSANSAPNGNGGGIYNEPNDDEGGTAIVTATHSTFWANSASGTGGAIHSLDATFTFSNTILAGSPSGGDCTQSGSAITDNGYNLVQDGSCLNAPTSITGNPVLGSLQNNGGPMTGVGGEDPMQTQALLPRSPAIDAIPTGACPAPADQRGSGRPFGYGCDIGAFETDTLSLEIAKLVDEANPEMGQTITFAIVVSNTGPGADGVTISDTLPTGLTPIGPITLDPPDAGAVGSQLPVLASGLDISHGLQVTVTFPVSVAFGLEGGRQMVNTASAGSAPMLAPVMGSVTVTVGNVPPVAVDDGGTGFGTDEDTLLTTGSVLANDSDANGDVLSVVSFDATGTKGQVTDKGDGTFDYDPNGQFEHLAAGEQVTDTFVYSASDGRGGSDTATVTITINGLDDGPQVYEVFLPLVVKGR